ncbi:MAG: hypothetical protein E6G22_00800, partial [Actinobacteria bacterium]
MTLDAAGDAVAVWADDGAVRSSTRPAATRTWSAPVDLGPGAEPAVAVDPAGDAAVVRISAGAVQTSFRAASSGTWSAPVDLGPGSEPQVALGRTGNAAAVWADGTLRAALRPVASATWLPAATRSRSGYAAG